MARPDTTDRTTSAPAPSGGMLAELAGLRDRAERADPQFATDFVSWLLRHARDEGASDVHVDPAADAVELRWRLDGVLQPLVRMPRDVGPNLIGRLKVLAGLLTYETALPQEGRAWEEALRVEVRVSTFPTLYGERAVLRLLGASKASLDSLPQLGLPPDVLAELERQVAETSGAILIVGPAGSGKTTTAYACLRHIVAHSGGGRSIASLEDPIEAAVEGVAQSLASAAAQLDMSTGLRSLLRLDPEVILIGEMRDRATAEIALQAALTGQLVITTFHAGNCHDAVNRLVEMGIPQYAVRNAVRLVVSQRLVRRLCGCAQPGDVERDAQPLGLDVSQCRIAAGCDACHATGYRGRALIADWHSMRGGGDSGAGDERLWSSAEALVEGGTTSAAEVVRVLGLRRMS